MVVKIKQAAASMKSPLDYNYRKVHSEDAEVIDVANIPGQTEREVRKEFRKYENLSIRTTRLAFHMSINPSEEERLSDQEIRRIAACLMNGLGYGSQPYVLFRHDDIERTHYHVVSIRTGLGGRKLPDRREYERCQTVMQEHSEEFGYKVGGQGGASESLPEMSVRFEPGGKDVLMIMEHLFRACCSYRFTSEAQFRLIMKRHGLEANVSGSDDHYISLRGLDLEGNPCTPLVDERDTSYDMYRSLMRRASDTLRQWDELGYEREVVSKIASRCLRESTGEDDFRLRMARNGIETELVRDGRGNVTDMLIIDHRSRCAFSDGDLTEFRAEDIRKKEEGGGWNEDESKGNSRHEDVAASLGMVLDAFLNSRGVKSRGKEPGNKKHKRQRSVRR